MNNYFYILTASLFIISQIKFVNYTEGIYDPPVQVFSVDEQIVTQPDADELVISYIFDNLTEIDDGLINNPMTLGLARKTVSMAYSEKYGSELIFPDEAVNFDEHVTREEFAVMFNCLCVDEPAVNVCEYITDVEQSNPNFQQISDLYKVGIISGNSTYGHFDGSAYITPKTVKAMITRLKNPDQRVVFNPTLQTNSFTLDFSCVKQNPELPTGCEITSLTSVLNYYGFGVDKLTMADVYLEKGNIGVTDPNVAFIGTPYERSSYGCYAPVIEKCADKFLNENQSQLSTYMLNGVTFKNLLTEVEQGYPVIVWASIDMKQTYNSSVWSIDDKQITWIANEHCLVIYGFDLEKNVVLVADPLVGNVEYDIDLFETRYNELMKQAVVIK